MARRDMADLAVDVAFWVLIGTVMLLVLALTATAAYVFFAELLAEAGVIC